MTPSNGAREAREGKMEKVKYEARWTEEMDGSEYEHLWRITANGASFTRETWCRSSRDWLYCTKTTHRMFDGDDRYWGKTMWKTDKFTPVRGVNRKDKRHLYMKDCRK
jgi:hypothetical protein